MPVIYTKSRTCAIKCLMLEIIFTDLKQEIIYFKFMLYKIVFSHYSDTLFDGHGRLLYMYNFMSQCSCSLVIVNGFHQKILRYYVMYRI